MDAAVEVQVLELRRVHGYWGPRRIRFKLTSAGVVPLPTESGIYRALLRAGMVEHLARHRRAEHWRRWERAAPMELWQMDVVGGFLLADGTHAKALTGVDSAVLSVDGCHRQRASQYGPDMEFTIRPVRLEDADDWSALYRDYRAFYKLADQPDLVARTRRWVFAGEHSLFGLVAVDDSGRLIGLANLRWFARPSTASIGLYLDDLFVLPTTRGTGVGSALLGRVREIAEEAGASVIRWITAEDNGTARRVYDRVATATAWVTYDMSPEVDEHR